MSSSVWSRLTIYRFAASSNDVSCYRRSDQTSAQKHDQKKGSKEERVSGISVQ